MRPRLFFVTDPRVPLARTIEIARAAGDALGSAFVVQLRAKELSFDETRTWAEALRETTRACGAGLVLNVGGAGDRLALARTVGADGVHVPKAHAGPDGWFSMPAHDDEDVLRASEARASAVLVSPIFATPGKGPPRGLEAVRRAVERARHTAVIALGGVDERNAGACFAAGAAGVAVIRALVDAEDPGRTARALVDHAPVC